jgi:hypothetical protein
MLGIAISLFTRSRDPPLCTNHLASYTSFRGTFIIFPINQRNWTTLFFFQSDSNPRQLWALRNFHPTLVSTVRDQSEWVWESHWQLSELDRWLTTRSYVIGLVSRLLSTLKRVNLDHVHPDERQTGPCWWRSLRPCSMNTHPNCFVHLPDFCWRITRS